MQFDLEYTLDMVKKLMAIDSPSGYTHNIIDELEKIVVAMGFEFSRNQKGNGIIHVPGKVKSGRALSAHVDTLGFVVRSITSSGTLKFSLVGGTLMPTADGEYCFIHTRCGKVYTGTMLSTMPAVHVFPEARTAPRDDKNMEIRLDEMVRSKEDVQKLGIQVGDFICLDPKTVITPSGFIKSRFLDDKLSVAMFLGILNMMKTQGIELEQSAQFLISTYEEVGHGMANIPTDVTEILAVDMGCIGLDLSCTEYDVSICAKDSGGPYDYGMTSKLIELAKREQLNYAIDIYPFYGSDAGAALRAGNDVKGALIGAGVAASHGMERSHIQGVENTMKLIMAYLQSE